MQLSLQRRARSPAAGNDPGRVGFRRLSNEPHRFEPVGRYAGRDSDPIRDAGAASPDKVALHGPTHRPRHQTTDP